MQVSADMAALADLNDPMTLSSHLLESIGKIAMDSAPADWQYITIIVTGMANSTTVRAEAVTPRGSQSLSLTATGTRSDTSRLTSTTTASPTTSPRRAKTSYATSYCRIMRSIHGRRIYCLNGTRLSKAGRSQIRPFASAHPPGLSGRE